MKRELWVPIVLVVLSAAFALIACLAWLTGGRVAVLLRSKLALGGLLLTLGAVSIGCGADEPSCYKPATFGDETGDAASDGQGDHS